jgi:hypothetical protein
MVSEQRSKVQIGFRNLIKKNALTLYLSHIGLLESYMWFCSCVGLIESSSHTWEGVTDVDYPPSFHQFRLLVLLVGAWNLTHVCKTKISGVCFACCHLWPIIPILSNHYTNIIWEPTKCALRSNYQVYWLYKVIL